MKRFDFVKLVVAVVKMIENDFRRGSSQKNACVTVASHLMISYSWSRA